MGGRLENQQMLKITVQHRGSIRASHPAALGLILRVPENFSQGNYLGKNKFDVAEIY